ncbi:MAG: transglycosylase SLT domain-containing protein [Oligoflexales bacterium]
MMRALGVVGLGLVLCWTTPLHAPTPPESYMLKPASTAPVEIDAALEKWFVEFTQGKELKDLTPEEFKEHIAKANEIEKLLASLSRDPNSEEYKAALTQAQALFEKVQQDVNAVNSPLTTHLFNVLAHQKVSSAVKTAVNQYILKYGANSCPRKDLVLKEINKDRALSLEQTQSLVSNIADFSSLKFRERALNDLLQLLNSKQHASLAPTIYPLAKDFPRLIDDNKWLAEMSQQKTEAKPEPTMQDKVLEVSKAGKCNTSKDLLFTMMNQKAGFAEMEQAANFVDGCFRRQGHNARLRLWRSLEPQLERTFGKRGKELAVRKRALVYWGQDQFDEAKKLIGQNLTNAKEEDREIIAENLFLLGKIEENQGDITAATEHFQKFVENYKEHPGHDEAVTSLVLLLFNQGKLDQALAFVDQIVKSQTLMEVDERTTPLLSFALFWSGRLHYKLGNVQEAQEMWRRVASEFYSSYYGALGHYMLERLAGHPFVLQPSRVKAFSADELYNKVEGKDRATLERILALLKFRLIDEAKCELSELVDDPQNHDRTLLKSLLTYAAGNWLQAIKDFGELPRSYRHSLPFGMERLLFPKTYDEVIQKYASKVGLDPDFIFAIIRQESVFNPAALSAVGAQGLMQIMPATAIHEIKKISPEYISKQEKNEILRAGKRKAKFYDVEKNVALGVHHVFRLMEKYKSPILVLSSYNASPRATERWLKNIANDDMLTFIERVPYKETKDYIKLVLRNYFYYKRWYNAPSLEMAHIESLVSVDDVNDKAFKVNKVSF